MHITNATCGRACQPLEQWYGSTREDHFLVGTNTGRNNAKGAKYIFQRIEGYQAETVVPPPPPPPTPLGWHVWPDATPASSPFERSTDIIAFEYNNGVNHQYGGADTWYPSWAADGNLYTPWTDGSVQDMTTGTTVHSGSGGHGPGGHGPSTTGFATVIGDDPANLVS